MERAVDSHHGQLASKEEQGQAHSSEAVRRALSANFFVFNGHAVAGQSGAQDVRTLKPKSSSEPVKAWEDTLQ